MTAAPILPERREWTVDDLVELPVDLNYELINGRLVVPPATPLHQDICVRIFNALDVDCPLSTSSASTSRWRSTGATSRGRTWW